MTRKNGTAKASKTQQDESTARERFLAEVAEMDGDGQRYVKALARAIRDQGDGQLTAEEDRRLAAVLAVNKADPVQTIDALAALGYLHSQDRDALREKLGEPRLAPKEPYMAIDLEMGERRAFQAPIVPPEFAKAQHDQTYQTIFEWMHDNRHVPEQIVDLFNGLGVLEEYIEACLLDAVSAGDNEQVLDAIAYTARATAGLGKAFPTYDSEVQPYRTTKERKMA